MLGFQLILFLVLLGFVVTAYMTLLLVCTYYVLGFVDVQFSMAWIKASCAF